MEPIHWIKHGANTLDSMSTHYIVQPPVCTSHHEHLHAVRTHLKTTIPPPTMTVTEKLKWRGGYLKDGIQSLRLHKAHDNQASGQQKQPYEQLPPKRTSPAWLKSKWHWSNCGQVWSRSNDRRSHWSDESSKDHWAWSQNTPNKTRTCWQAKRKKGNEMPGARQT